MPREVNLKIGPGRSFVHARLPKGHTSPAATSIQTALAKLRESQRLSSGAKCTVVFFRKGGGFKAVQRCEGRKLSAAAKRRMKSSPPCVGNKHKFVKCTKGRKYALRRRRR